MPPPPTARIASTRVVGVAGLGDVALGPALDRARGECRVVVHAEHDDAGLGRTFEDAARELEAGDGRQVDVDDAEVGALDNEDAFAVLGVGGLQNLDLALVGQHGTAAGGDNGMIVDDQNAHRRSP
ncbi:hypothetical protein ACVWXN_001312 [Bradyrhizobium sp. i1.4.4]